MTSMLNKNIKYNFKIEWVNEGILFLGLGIVIGDYSGIIISNLFIGFEKN